VNVTETEDTKEESRDCGEDGCEENSEPYWHDLIGMVGSIDARFKKGKLRFVACEEAKGGCCDADNAAVR